MHERNDRSLLTEALSAYANTTVLDDTRESLEGNFFRILQSSPEVLSRIRDAFVAYVMNDESVSWNAKAMTFLGERFLTNEEARLYFEEIAQALNTVYKRNE